MPVTSPDLRAESASTLRRRIRGWLVFFIVALALSGITAYPLQTELAWLGQWFGVDAPGHPEGGLQWWIRTVRDGLRATDTAYPWLAYGTDWLAFGHLVIAIFFIGVYRDPVRNVWNLQVGLIACALLPLNAFICGAIRGIPFYWQLIDCSFGVIGAVPLWYVLRLTRRLEQIEMRPAV
jgi:hypothetical protein